MSSLLLAPCRRFTREALGAYELLGRIFEVPEGLDRIIQGRGHALTRHLLISIVREANHRIAQLDQLDQEARR